MNAAAQTFRINPKLDIKQEITQLGVGKALVSVLDEKGAPTIVEKTKIRPPESRMGPATASERKQVISESPVLGKYDTTIDRKSAFELLSARAERCKRKTIRERKYKKPTTKKSTSRSNSRSTTNTVIRSVTKIITSRIGQQLVRGILGSFFKGR